MHAYMFECAYSEHIRSYQTIKHEMYWDNLRHTANFQHMAAIVIPLKELGVVSTPGRSHEYV